MACSLVLLKSDLEKWALVSRHIYFPGKQEVINVSSKDLAFVLTLCFSFKWFKIKSLVFLNCSILFISNRKVLINLSSAVFKSHSSSYLLMLDSALQSSYSFCQPNFASWLNSCSNVMFRCTSRQLPSAGTHLHNKQKHNILWKEKYWR